MRSAAPSRCCSGVPRTPVLIGEPGVGKTAIVEGLAQRIVNGEVPESLKSKRILALDMGALIAGAKFPRRVRGATQGGAQRSGQAGRPGDLFIDELHTVVGAGKAEGHGCGQHAQPALARGELHCVGATTLDEYRKYIEKDAALERRFQKVLVDEPSVEERSRSCGLQEPLRVPLECRDREIPAMRAARRSVDRIRAASATAARGDRPATATARIARI